MSDDPRVLALVDELAARIVELDGPLEWVEVACDCLATAVNDLLGPNYGPEVVSVDLSEATPEQEMIAEREAQATIARMRRGAQ